MFHPFQPLVYTAEAITSYGEPTRLASDRTPGVHNPISVRALHAPYEPGTYLRGEHRCRAMLDRSVMVEEPPAYVSYTIDRPGVPSLAGVVGLLDLNQSSLHAHEAVMASAVAACSADIERAGAFLEPVVVASLNGLRLPTDDGERPMRTVAYGDERHTIAALPQNYAHGLDADTEFVVIDGHHRIAAAREHARRNGLAPSILALVVDVAAAGLHVVPQHRVLGGRGLDHEHLPGSVARRVYTRGDAVAPGDVAIVDHERSYLLSVVDDRAVGPLSRISSVTLRDHVLEPLDVWVQGFATREADAFEMIDSGACAVAIMGDLAMEDIVATASTGIVLPEKTTCFSPKVAVGLVGVTV